MFEIIFKLKNRAPLNTLLKKLRLTPYLKQVTIRRLPATLIRTKGSPIRRQIKGLIGAVFNSNLARPDVLARAVVTG